MHERVESFCTNGYPYLNTTQAEELQKASKYGETILVQHCLTRQNVAKFQNWLQKFSNNAMKKSNQSLFRSYKYINVYSKL